MTPRGRLTEAIQAETACKHHEAVQWLASLVECILEALEEGDTVLLDDVGAFRARKFPRSATRARVRVRTRPRASYALVETAPAVRERLGGRMIYLLPGRRLFAACQVQWLKMQGRVPRNLGR